MFLSHYITTCILFLCCQFSPCDKNENQSINIKALQEWRAGETVDEQAVMAYGLEKCFAASPISDKIWERMQGKTYKKNQYINRNDLRHVRTLHWDYDNKIHIGEMICNKLIADRLVEIYRLLYDAKYPIQRMVLPDVYDANDEAQMRANNSSCFNYRMISGSKNLSKHARGLAVDINPLYNPYYRKLRSGKLYIQPANAMEYCDRTKTFPYKIDHNDLAYKLFKERGFQWGGDWKSMKDFQHFELIE